MTSEMTTRLAIIFDDTSPDSDLDSPNEQQQLREMAPCVKESMEQLARLHDAISVMLDGLLEAGVAQLDAIKTSYVEQLNSLKSTVTSSCQDTAQKWQVASGDILQTKNRLETVKVLVGSLARMMGAQE